MPTVCDGLEPPITETRYATIRGSLRLDHYFTNTFPIQTTFFMVDQDHEFSSLDGEVVLSRDWLSHLFWLRGAHGPDVHVDGKASGQVTILPQSPSRRAAPATASVFAAPMLQWCQMTYQKWLV